MGLFSRKEKRNQKEEVKNPCPIQDDSINSAGLSNLIRMLGKTSPMNISAFFDAVNIIANAIAKIPFLFKNENDEPLKRTHYLYHLFDNAKLTKFMTIKSAIKDLLLYGNGFIFIERDPETYKPKTLYYSAASQTSMFYNPLTNELFFSNPLFKGGKWDNGENYIHLYINSENGFQGKAINDYAYKTISLASSTEKACEDYYSSGGQLYGILTTNGAMPNVGTREKQVRELRASWDEARSASKGTGTIFIPADLKFTQLSSNAKDSAMIETRLYNVQEVARWFSLSPVLLGDYTHTHYSSLSDADIEFVRHTLQPYIVMVEQELNRKLIMPSKRDFEFIDLDEVAIISIDKEKQSNYLTTLVSNGIMTPNEARKELGLPPIEGADDLSIPYTDAEQNKITGKEDEDKNTTQEENEDKQN